MTPQDWRGDRYLINFVDYSTNYARVFVYTNKFEATRNFEHHLVYFESRFIGRAHVLRSYGCKEYVKVDSDRESAGVRRQVSEAANQASNGKAERIHSTVSTCQDACCLRLATLYIFEATQLSTRLMSLIGARAAPTRSVCHRPRCWWVRSLAWRIW